MELKKILYLSTKYTTDNNIFNDWYMQTFTNIRWKLCIIYYFTNVKESNLDTLK